MSGNRSGSREVARRLGVSERHVRRLRAARDPRVAPIDRDLARRYAQARQAEGLAARTLALSWAVGRVGGRNFRSR